MNEKALSRGKLLAAGGVAAGAAVAGASPALAVATNANAIVGSWHNVVTITDPPGFGTVDLFETFTSDGTMIDSRRLYVPFAGALSDTGLLSASGHGAWKRTGNRRYAARFQTVVQKAPPSLGDIVGYDTVDLTLELDPGGDTVSGTFLSTLRAPAGFTLIVLQATLVGTRIAV